MDEVFQCWQRFLQEVGPGVWTVTESAIPSCCRGSVAVRETIKIGFPGVTRNGVYCRCDKRNEAGIGRLHQGRAANSVWRETGFQNSSPRWN